MRRRISSTSLRFSSGRICARKPAPGIHVSLLQGML
jgi:hypothetical protein